jgi:CMP-N-acetylneuraminic acid synthetase
MNILAIIPARSGSKSIVHKNIQSIHGLPLMAYSIQFARESNLISRIILSTDSEDYAAIGRSYGAETPFIRPLELAQDHSTDLEVFEHALHWLYSNENYKPDLLVHLRPTTPFRKKEDLKDMIEMLSNSDADCIRSLVKNLETPYKMWFLGEQCEIRPVINDKNYPEAFNMPRQILPPTYLHNGCIDVIRTRTILEKKSMTGDKILGYVMDEHLDIDYPDQLANAINNSITLADLKNKCFCFDIDGVIAHISPDLQYNLAKPFNENIQIVNRLYDLGNHIILFTARGTKTGINWMEITTNQMKQWGVKYHELKTGKPAADYYVDDRLISIAKLTKVLSA